MTKELPLLTPLRGMAALMVVLFHARLVIFPHVLEPINATSHLIEAGYLWVDLFFMLSGLVLAWCYLQRYKQIGWARFVWLRASRIYPLLLVTLGVLFAWELSKLVQGWVIDLGPEFEHLGFNGVAAFGSYHNDVRGLVAQSLLLHGPTYYGLSWNMPSWSLSIEWCLYLGFGALIPLAHQRSPWRHLIPIVALLMYYSLQYRNATLDVPYGEGAVLRGAIGFVTGIYLSTLIEPLRQRTWLQTPWLLLAVFALPWGLMHLTKDGPVALFTMASFMVLILIGAIQTRPHWGLALLDNAASQWLGRISLSIYLWHYPLLMISVEGLSLIQPQWLPLWYSQTNGFSLVAATVGYLAVLLLLSHVSYYCIELPAQGWLRSRRWQRPDWMRSERKAG